MLKTRVLKNKFKKYYRLMLSSAPINYFLNLFFNTLVFNIEFNLAIRPSIKRIYLYKAIKSSTAVAKRSGY